MQICWISNKYLEKREKGTKILLPRSLNIEELNDRDKAGCFE